MEYKIEIKASAQKVWFVLWDDFHYRNWTSAFSEGSYAVTDNWKEGSKVHFLTPKGKGVYSIIEENKPFEKIFFRHIGNIDNFKELPLDDETNKWSGMKERYSLNEKNGITSVVVTIDLYDKFIDFFDIAFPKALEKIKNMAEHFYISVQTSVNATIEKVWEKWNDPVAITKWCTATETWHTPKAENNLQVGAMFKYRMEAKDGSMGFDLSGIYTSVETNKKIAYTLEDGRMVIVNFEQDTGKIKIIESFEAEMENPFEMQRDGWQNILNNFKIYIENE